LPDAVKTKSHQSAPEKKTEISVQPTDPKINQTAQSIVVALARTATPSQPSTPVQGDEPAQASSQPPRRSINANASAGQAQTQAPAANTKASAEKENQSADVSVPASDVGKEKVNTVNPAAPAIPIAQTSIAASVPAVSAVEGIAATSPTAAAPALVQPAAAVPVPVTPQAAFVAANHPPIVMGMSGKLLPDGGTMHIRLAPPELGDLQISVHVSEGTVAASFETSNEQATRLLSHSLGELKISLESAGITVEKLQVSQMPSGTQGQGADGQSGRQKSDDQAQPDGQAPARDQQRREMLRRMWRRLAGDPLDLVA
jgi:flagellar hook-length control protein FliK